MLAPGYEYEQVLFLTPRDPEAERWTGMRTPLADSLQTAWGYDHIARTGSIDYMVKSQMKQSPVLHLISSLRSASDDVPPDLEYYDKIDERIPGIDVKNSSRLLERMRMIKSDAEITRIEKAIEVTHRGLTDLLAAVTPGVSEFQLDGILEQSIKQQGAQHMAFPPIVGAGEGSIILHYERHNREVEPGQLLLLDVGAEWDHYCADISRTVPVDGKFTERQAEIYDLVLEAQDSSIAMIRPGVTMLAVHDAAERVFRRAGYIDYFIHSVSHHLGVDVHDAANYNLTLASGMVITIEPGIYIQAENIGIRIEDDLLVTDKGSRILSNEIPRGRVAVEQWIGRARSQGQ
jgi:Xaa-Pro aminopeptidase